MIAFTLFTAVVVLDINTIWCSALFQIHRPWSLAYLAHGRYNPSLFPASNHYHWWTLQQLISPHIMFNAFHCELYSTNFFPNLNILLLFLNRENLIWCILIVWKYFRSHRHSIPFSTGKLIMIMWISLLNTDVHYLHISLLISYIIILFYLITINAFELSVLPND